MLKLIVWPLNGLQGYDKTRPGWNRENNFFIRLCGASGDVLRRFAALGMHGYRQTLKLIVGRLNGLCGMA
jgi:hypothetical protein